jgi:hypothetical protein
MEDQRQSSQEARASGDKSENIDRQTLNDATFEPEAYVEQIGDFRQAEAIQQDILTLVKAAPPAEAVAPHRPEEADRSKASVAPEEGGSGKVDAIPITVPDVHAAADEVSSLPLPLPKPAAAEQPLIRGMAPDPIVRPKDAAAAPSLKVESLPLDGEVRVERRFYGKPETGEEAGSLPIPIPGEKVPAAQRESAAMDENPPPPPDAEMMKPAASAQTQESVSETEEEWIPPEMYAHGGPDGKITVVGADGKPVDSPPVIQKVVDANGMEKYVAYYPGAGPGDRVGRLHRLARGGLSTCTSRRTARRRW